VGSYLFLAKGSRYTANGKGLDVEHYEHSAPSSSDTCKVNVRATRNKVSAVSYPVLSEGPSGFGAVRLRYNFRGARPPRLRAVCNRRRVGVLAGVPGCTPPGRHSLAPGVLFTLSTRRLVEFVIKVQ